MALSHTRYVLALSWRVIAGTRKRFSTRISNEHSGGGDCANNSTIRAAWRRQLSPPPQRLSDRPLPQHQRYGRQARRSAHRYHHRSKRRPATRSCRPFAHPASTIAIAITASVLRICFDSRKTTHPQFTSLNRPETAVPGGRKIPKIQAKCDLLRRGNPVTRTCNALHGRADRFFPCFPRHFAMIATNDAYRRETTHETPRNKSSVSRRNLCGSYARDRRTRPCRQKSPCLARPQILLVRQRLEWCRLVSLWI
jgi:hypothetical protein